MTSHQIQAVLSSQITDRILDHEAMRFTKMTIKQLTTRLYKITKPVKLEAFRVTAEVMGLRKLAKIAKEKRDFMYS